MGLFKSLKGKATTGVDAPQNRSSPPAYSHYSNATHDQYTTGNEKQQVYGESSSGPLQPVVSTASAPHHPPNSSQQPPLYHDWTSVPDENELPPPPAIQNKFSPTNNASEDDAERAHVWCTQHLPYLPAIPPAAIYNSVQAGEIVLQKPVGFDGRVKRIEKGHGSCRWHIQTGSMQHDTTIMSVVPMYFATMDNQSETTSPTQQIGNKTIYFEVKLNQVAPDSIVALGFAAKPYPPHRLSGWHRASLAVHSDDGHRYINDPEGGLDFVQPFSPTTSGEVVGIGVSFSRSSNPQYMDGMRETEGFSQSTNPLQCRAFFTRNGFVEGEWQIDEERDAEHDGVEGLIGDGDLYLALGVSGMVDVEVISESISALRHPSNWKYDPRSRD